jgi:large subunit ribosomal protein L10
MPSKANINKVEVLTDKFKKSSAMYFTKYTGMDVDSATKLRMDFTNNDVDFYIAKNTLTKLAAKNAGYDDIFNSILNGQIGIAYAGDDPTAPAKVIKNFAKDNENFEVVGLYFDGTLYDPSKYKELADLPSRDELLTKLVYGLNSPITKIAMSLNSVMAKLAGTLTSLKEQKQ